MTEERGPVGEVSGAGWVTRFRRRAPALSYTLALWLGTELLAALLLPAIVPKHIALSWYLGEHARWATGIILDVHDTSFTVYDSLTGWRNRPGSSGGRWQIDSLGSRSTHRLHETKTRPRRLLFLGSSLTNGGDRVSAVETISAYCEDSLTESVNCATMLYSLDQVALAYRGSLHRLGADVVVVGTSAAPEEGLTNRYLPFFAHSEVLMPFFKPRFLLDGDSLRLVPVPTREQWRAMFHSSAMLDTLTRDEGFLDRFESYRRLGLMPLTASLRQALITASKLSLLLTGRRDALPLAERLMRMLADDAAGHGAKVVFMLLPARRFAFPTGLWRLLPDHYADLLARLRREGFVVLDGRDLLRRSGLPPDRLYSDGNHFQPEGNRLIAAGLRELLDPAGGATLAGVARAGRAR